MRSELGKQPSPSGRFPRLCAHSRGRHACHRRSSRSSLVPLPLKTDGTRYRWTADTHADGLALGVFTSLRMTINSIKTSQQVERHRMGEKGESVLF